MEHKNVEQRSMKKSGSDKNSKKLEKSKKNNSKAKKDGKPKSSKDNKVYQCATCNNFFSSQKTLRRHEVTHYAYEDLPYSCDICSKKFARKEYLKVHNLQHEGVYLYECFICHKGFRRKHELQKHQKLHVECGICEESFVGHKELERHMVIHEKSSSAVLSNRKKRNSPMKLGVEFTHEVIKTSMEFVCPICKIKFRNEAVAEIHHKLHSAEITSHLYEDAKKIFVNIDTVEAVQEVEDPKQENEGELTCKGCLKRFINSYIKERHEELNSCGKVNVD